MEVNKDIQTPVNTIPAFTVLKNGSILKNIFLLRKQSAVDKSSRNQESDEQVLLFGRHPHCHVTLGHPSISRHHLRVHSNPSLHMISVVDLSSVHGTWVSGKRIEPGVQVVLKERDTVKMGGSSRVYELHWVPQSQVYNVDEQFVPRVCTIKEGEEEESDQMDDQKHDAYLSDNDLDGLDASLSNEILNLLTSSGSSEDSSPRITDTENGEPLATVSIQAPLVTSEAISDSEISDCLNKSEDKLNSLRDNLSKESEQISHGTIEDDLASVDRFNSVEAHERGSLNQDSSPRKTDTENGEPLATLSIQAPLVTSEAISESGISDCLNKSEDKLNSLGDIPSKESEQISHGTIEDDMASMDCYNSIEAHERGSLNQDIERSNETDIENENGANKQQKSNSSVPVVLFDGVYRDLGCEFVQHAQTKMMNESDSMVVFDGVVADVNSESVDHEMKEESVFVLPDVTHLDQEKPLTPDISMNQQSMQGVSASKNLFHSLDGKELEFYTPDKENKNPNACSGKSLSKKAVKRGAGCEFEQMDQMQMMDKSASMVVFDGVDMGVKSDLVDHEIKVKSNFVLSDVTDQEKTSTPDIPMNLLSVQNMSASMKVLDSFGKENKNANDCSGKSLSKKSVNPTVFQEKDILGFSQNLFATDEGMESEHKVDAFVNCEEVLVSSEKDNTSRQRIIKGSCNSINEHQTVQKTVHSCQNLAKKSWTMVVDTNSLLDNKSLKHLKLLEGIKGTRLFVPKIVVNELMDIKSQDHFFKRSSKAVSLALKWMDECVMNTIWWIHMDDEIVYSSTAVPEVLEIALRLRKEIADQKIIILSNNLTLKIKAMAEGLMCEAAEEFQESLVNPFSERFMWVGSSARGLTWSCVEDDDDIVRQKYHGSGLNRSHGFKGLKLLATCQSCY
ncbi:hypothetical protein R6Q59_034313 [Mikania micrantha]